MKTEFVELVLTCASWQEAQRIADSLLEKKLAACIEMFEVKSRYRWHGRLHEADEIKLMMQSAAHLFDEVESEVRKLHSYEAFVLEALPIERISGEAGSWLKEETK